MGGPAADASSASDSDVSSRSDGAADPAPAARDAATTALDAGSASPSDAGATDVAAPAADAQLDVAPGSDAAPVDGLPAWAASLVGTYGKRSVTFSVDDAPGTPLNTRNVEHAIVKIVQTGNMLSLSSQMCSYTVVIKGAQGSPPLVFKNATSMPPLLGRIVLGATNSFSSEPMLQHLGFDPARGNSCNGAGRRAKFEDQTWITGTSCECYPTSVPEHIDDCRVIDSDGDGKPGITTHGPSPLGTTVSDYAFVFDYSVTIVDGKVGVNRMHELREVRAQEPSCINFINDGCSIGNNQLCPGGFTRLIPLDAAATCASLNTGDFGPPDPFPVEVDCRAK